MSANEKQVRIGPISLFTLIAVLCLATLAVLSVTTSNASYNMAMLQGESVDQQYRAEKAAQAFVAQIDERSNQSAGSTSDRAQALAGQLDGIIKQIQSSSDGITISARVDGPSIDADFSCENGRTLDIVITLQDGGSYTITKWNMTAKQNEAESGNLWTGI